MRQSQHLAPTSLALLAAVFVLSGVARAAPPQTVFLTAAGQPAVGTVLYVLPYAVSDPTGTPQAYNAKTRTITGGATYPTQTIVSITLPETVAGTKCEIQVEWVDWQGATIGVSGPAVVVSGFTYEFTTAFTPPGNDPPYVLNVFSNLNQKTVPYEGRARIRAVDCSTKSLSVDAGYEMEVPAAAGTARALPVLKPIMVVRPSGNVGE